MIGRVASAAMEKYYQLIKFHLNNSYFVYPLTGDSEEKFKKYFSGVKKKQRRQDYAAVAGAHESSNAVMIHRPSWAMVFTWNWFWF